MGRINSSRVLLAAIFSVSLVVTSYASDHVDGPRAIENPTSDITDLFAFPSPERPGHLVLVMNVHPYAGLGTRFSDALEYTFIVRRVRVRSGQDEDNGPSFISDREVRVTCSADSPKVGTDGTTKTQRVVCDGANERPAIAVLNDSSVQAVSNNKSRLFVGVRSDPFFLDIATLDNEITLRERLLTKANGTNTIADANVLSIVLELDVKRLYGDDTLLAVAAEITSRSSPSSRIDRVGRSEVSNIFLGVQANVGLHDHDTLKEIYNSEAPFAVSVHNLGRYRDRILASLYFYDRFDDTLDWRLMPGRMPFVNMLLQDHLVVDVAKPCGDRNVNYLEIERAVLRGEPHQTCGGRRLNDDVIGVTYTLMVKGPKMNSEKLIVVGANAPTKWAEQQWPYLASPNSQRATAARSVTLKASCPDVWEKIGGLGSLPNWHPGVAKIKVGGSGAGAIRTVFLKNGKLIVEQLGSVDRKNSRYTYEMLSGPLPLTNYRGTLTANSARAGAGCTVVWSSEFEVVGAPKLIVVDALKGIYSAGLNNIKQLFSSSN